MLLVPQSIDIEKTTLRVRVDLLGNETESALEKLIAPHGRSLRSLSSRIACNLIAGKFDVAIYIYKIL